MADARKPVVVHHLHHHFVELLLEDEATAAPTTAGGHSALAQTVDLTRSAVDMMEPSGAVSLAAPTTSVIKGSVNVPSGSHVTHHHRHLFWRGPEANIAEARAQLMAEQEAATLRQRCAGGGCATR